ncbi:MAG: arginine deiminase-related protein [Bacteroidia bacterium]|nr:arginine deiminase-related protein [Bacteroidia bacterium]
MDLLSRRQLQFTSHLMMIRPVRFGFNEQTAESNAFQQKSPALSSAEIQARALEEFDTFVKMLRDVSVTVTVFDDTPEPHTPDSIFPNNWISLHRNGQIFIYPMLAPNRQAEIRSDIIQEMTALYANPEVVDFRKYAGPGQYLEGTGSMILDRAAKVVYACISPRTHPELLRKFCQKIQYRLVEFHAMDEHGQEIYHTNVLMGLGEGYAVICLEAIPDESERQNVITSLRAGGFEIIPLTFFQMNNFAGNLLQVVSQDGIPWGVLSRRAYDSLDELQKKTLQHYTRILVVPLDVVEVYGGGSVRCMMAEVFPEVK